MRIRSGTITIAALLNVIIGAAGARAQSSLGPLPRPTAGGVEVALGATINSLETDPNAWPACTSLALPCTHEHPGDAGGLGVNVGVTRSIGERVGMTVAAEISAHGFDSALEPQTHRSSTDAITAFMLGPTIRTAFSRPRGPRHESERLFAQLLVGVQKDSIFDTRPMVQAAAGADSLGPFGRRGGIATIRLAAGYRLTPGARYGAGGLWFFLGVVFGDGQR